MFPIGDSARGRATPAVTIAVLAVNVLVFVYELGLAPAALDRFVFVYGVVPARQSLALEHAPGALDAWLTPLVTSMFLHGGWVHLAGNMLFLWTFAPAVEQTLGAARFAAFYTASGIVASQAQVLADPASMIPMIGASGAIAGVLGGYLILFPLARVSVMLPILFLPLILEVPAVFFLVLWFFEQLLVGSIAALTPAAGVAGGVAWWAHVGGFVAGGVLVIAFGTPEARRARRPGGRARGQLF